MSGKRSKVVERSGLKPCRLPPPLPQRHRVRSSPRSRRVPAGIEDGWGFPVQEGSGSSDRGPRYRSTVQVPRLLSPPKPCTTKQYLHAGHGPVESSLATRSGCGSFFGRVARISSWPVCRVTGAVAMTGGSKPAAKPPPPRCPPCDSWPPMPATPLARCLLPPVHPHDENSGEWEGTGRGRGRPGVGSVDIRPLSCRRGAPRSPCG